MLTETPLLLPLLPKDVPDKWIQIQAGIKESLLDDRTITDAEMTEILESLLLRRMQCWFGGMSSENGNHEVLFEPYVMIITTIVRRSLVVLGLVKYNDPDAEMAKSLILQLKNIAKAWGLESISSVSNQDEIIDAVKSIGGKADYTVLSLEV